MSIINHILEAQANYIVKFCDKPTTLYLGTSETEELEKFIADFANSPRFRATGRVTIAGLEVFQVDEINHLRVA